MMKMIRCYKVEIRPNKAQKKLIEEHFGVTRKVFNMYLNYCKENGFISAYSFSKILNHSSDRPDYFNKISSKAIKQSIINAEKSFQKSKGKFRFKSKHTSRKSFYLIGTFHVERHRIFLPKLKWVRLKEYGYIKGDVKSVTLSKRAERYFISCLVEKEIHVSNSLGNGIGIDLGLKDLAICSNGLRFGNINKSNRVKKLEKKLKRYQKSLSRMLESNMYSKIYFKSGKKKGQLKSFKFHKPLSQCKNFQKMKVKVNKLFYKLECIRNDYINKMISFLMKRKPNFISIENLNILGMMKNKYLANKISKQKWFYFVTRLKQKCLEYGVELRQVDKFYPSSKLCSSCGFKNVNLKLKDRFWNCPSCGALHDRDVNASVNLFHAKDYSILV